MGRTNKENLTSTVPLKLPVRYKRKAPFTDQTNSAAVEDKTGTKSVLLFAEEPSLSVTLKGILCVPLLNVLAAANNSKVTTDCKQGKDNINISSVQCKQINKSLQTTIPANAVSNHQMQNKQRSCQLVATRRIKSTRAKHTDTGQKCKELFINCPRIDIEKFVINVRKQKNNCENLLVVDINKSKIGEQLECSEKIHEVPKIKSNLSTKPVTNPVAVHSKQLVINLINSNLNSQKSAIIRKEVPDNYSIVNKNKISVVPLGVENEGERKTVTLCSKQLRKPNAINYAEDSLNTTENTLNVPDIKSDASKPSQKLPIYKKVIVDKPQKKINESKVYEFDEFENEEPRPRKQISKKKISMFDKTTYEILKKIEQKEAKQLKKQAVLKKTKKGAKTAPSNTTNYEKTVNRIVDSVKNKIQRKQNAKRKENNSGSGVDRKKNTSYKIQQVEIQNDEISLSKDNITLGKTDSALEVANSIYDYQARNNESGHSSQKSPLFEYEDATDFFPSDNEANGEDEYFGFSEEPEERAQDVAVKIISNVVVRKSRVKVDSPSLFHNQKPNANSTICRRPHDTSETWRFCLEEAKRNPHFLDVKKSALPSLTQDPIIDHTLDVDTSTRTNMCSNVTVGKTASPKKPLVQTNITDYLEGDIDHFKENIENRRTTHSLFDWEEFNSPRRDNDEVLVILQKQTLKRKVLGVSQADNVMLESTSSFDDTVSGESVSFQEFADNKRITYFGFDNTEDDCANMKNLNPEPFRINANGVKKYMRTRKKSLEKQIMPDPEVQPEEASNLEIDINEGENNRDVENENHVNKLFDDPESIFDDKMLSPKIKKKRCRHLSTQSDDEVETNKPRKKRKDIMTKSEEERFEEWAAAFNSMCAEVEKHELEID